MSTFLSGVISAVMLLNGLWLCNRVAAINDFTFVFECANPSTPPKAMFNEVVRISNHHCDFWKINEPTNPNDPRYQIYYTCREKGANCRTVAPWPRCDLQSECSCCRSTFAGAMCQYDLYSMKRLFSCTPLFDEMNMREPIEQVDESDHAFQVTTDPLPTPQTSVTDRPYCNDGALNMIIHPCCVAPLMLVVEKAECKQKVLCGSRREVGAAFKLAGEDDTTIGPWTGLLRDAWDRLSTWQKSVLNRVRNKLDACMNMTSGNEDQCGRCKAQVGTVGLHEMGYKIAVW
ncbi:uncharacterized protein LOC129594594 [Paramacrobiotus metropolitanus]|uniref:uncharacterized protein LOC129594594 n=1 Tax=Paramacrobiotus metropolitanus TaxID=2943436 RepID=UPI0024463609|nr:uncharacterized protein LOC129594594 [Paramacrobiotus metropolitanus]